MMQMLPTYNFKWVEDTSQFNEVFIKNYNEKVKYVIFFTMMLSIWKKYRNCMETYHFYPREKKCKKSKSL